MQKYPHHASLSSTAYMKAVAYTKVISASLIIRHYKLSEAFTKVCGSYYLAAIEIGYSKIKVNILK